MLKNIQTTTGRTSRRRAYWRAGRTACLVVGIVATGLGLGGCPPVASETAQETAERPTSESAIRQVAQGTALTVTFVNPSSGPTAGGYQASVSGTGFAPGMTVLFGDVAASNVVVNQHWAALVTVPAHPAGLVDVTVIKNSVTATLEDGFRYITAPLTLGSIAPLRGPAAGGTEVLLTGGGFADGVAVTFDGVPASEVKVVNDQLVTAVAPPHAPGVVDVAVLDGESEVQLAEVYEYLSPDADLPPNDGTDTDGDGLTDYQEVVGWEIRIDLYGFGTGGLNGVNLHNRTVYSDPSTPDTDGDGLDDYGEWFVLSDPEVGDTDADGLGDYEEVNVQLTSPVSVDTDGDARGPDGDLPPNAALFDGAELVEYFSDDGRLFYGGTSPIFDDTDGDGVTDYDEFAHPLRSALVADVPRMKVDFVGELVMALDISLEEGTSVTEGQEYGLTESESSATTTSNESTWENSLEFTESIEATVGYGGSPPGWYGEATVGFSATQGFSEGGSTSWSEESAQETQNSFLEIQEESRTQSQTINGGTVTAGIKVINEGNIAFTLENLVLSARLIDQQARDGFRPIATLFPPVDQLTLSAFEETGMLVVTTDVGSIGAEMILELMADPSALVLDVAAFDLLDADGRNFAFLNDVTNARTATVIVDLGLDRPIETYRVATEVVRNPDGTAAGITMGDVMNKVLRIPFETQPRSGAQPPPDPNLPALQDGVQLLTKVRDVEQDPTAFWAVFGSAVRGDALNTDFQDIVLRANESISLVYTEDRDEDGVYKREEFMYLASDEDSDTDDDQLDDFLEIRVGWDIFVLGPVGLKHVYPDPTRVDFDQDGLDDRAERLGQDGLPPGDPNDSLDATDPKNPDTDGDGLRDDEDNCPLDPGNPAPAINLTKTEDVSGSVVSLTGNVLEDPGDGRCDVDNIDTIVFDWGDGQEDTLSGVNFPADPTNIPVDIEHTYSSQGDYTITVTATDVRGASAVETFGVEITFPTEGLVAFYPMNDEVTVDNVVRDVRDPLAPPAQRRDGEREDAFTRDHVNRFGSASGAFCLVQDQVIDGANYAGVSLPPIPVPGADNGLAVTLWVIPGNFSHDGIVVGQAGFCAFFADGTGNGLHFTIKGPDDTYYTLRDDDPNVPDVPTQVAGEAGCPDDALPENWTFYAATVVREGNDSIIRLYRGAGADLGVPGASFVQKLDEVVVSGVVFTNPDDEADWQISREHEAFGPVPGAQDTNGQPYEGRIDDVRIYERYLAEVELNALFNEGDNSDLPGNGN